MEKVQRDLKSVESRYGEDVLQLVIASGYLSKLVANAEINRYLGQHHQKSLSSPLGPPPPSPQPKAPRQPSR
jgi:hypothetical protein